MYATIDALVDRVDAQFRKWKGRLVSHKPVGTRKSQARSMPDETGLP
jgi:putative sigma-54 modulation protein